MDETEDELGIIRDPSTAKGDRTRMLERHYDGLLDMMPDNGVLLSGFVTTVSGLPPVASGENDGRVFFRVFYVENAPENKRQPSSFQGKTTIYTSDPSESAAELSWEDASFTFEIIMAEELIVKNPKFRGQIVFAFYRMRAQGGSDVLGQITFNLADVATRGSNKNHKSSTDLLHNNEIRSLQGYYSLCSRGGDVITDARTGMGAEIGVQLDLLWRSVIPVEAPPVTSRAPVNAPVTTGRDEWWMKDDDSITSNISKTVKPGKSSGMSRPSSAASGVAGKRSSSANRLRPSTAAVKPASSGLHSKQKREDQRRIEMENKIMQAKLGKLATKQGQAQSSANKSIGNYSSVPTKRSITSDRPQPRSKAVAGDTSYQTLLVKHDKMKQEVSAMQTNNAGLKAQLGRIKTQIKKSGTSNTKYREESEAEGSKDMNKVASTPVVQKDFGGMSEDLVGMGEVIESCKVRDLKEIENTKDSLLKEKLLEFHTIQEARRLLVARIINAKSLHRANEAKLVLANERVSTATTVVVKPSTERPLAKSMSGARLKGGLSRQQQMQDNMDTTTQAEYDALIRQKVQKLSREVLKLKAIEENSSYSFSIDADLEELSATVTHLEEVLRKEKEKLGQIKYDGDMWEERLLAFRQGGQENDEHIANSSAVYKLRDVIAAVRAVYMSKYRSMQSKIRAKIV